jgi:AraC-like DNA-binding protein
MPGGEPDDGELLASARGRVVLERRLLRARDGLVGLAQTFTGTGVRTVVTHGAAVLAWVRVERGRLSFPLASGDEVAPERFLLALPPRAVLPMRFDDARVESEGVAAFARFAPPCTALLDARLDGDGPGAMPLDLASARRLAGADVLLPLDADRGVPPAIAEARRLLHEKIANPAPVRAVARAIGMSPEHLTRAFSRAYCIPPKQYCNRARLFEAVLRLLSGAPILDVALGSGFNDLKRFYVQFRRLLRSTPGVYAAIRKRQDRRAAMAYERAHVRDTRRPRR